MISMGFSGSHASAAVPVKPRARHSVPTVCLKRFIIFPPVKSCGMRLRSEPKLLADDVLLDFAGAAEDLKDLGLAEMALHGVFH